MKRQKKKYTYMGKSIYKENEILGKNNASEQKMREYEIQN